MSRLIQVLEREIVDPALAEQLAQDNEEAHQVARVGRKDAISVCSSDVLGGGAHGRGDDFARRVHEEFGEPFEDFLDDLRVGLLQVLDGEIDAYIGDAACDLVVWLWNTGQYVLLLVGRSVPTSVMNASSSWGFVRGL
jgi:hypothetical protein